MKRLTIITISLFIALSFGLSISFATQTTHERRIALVIGNSAYKSSPLRNPANDAQDMAATLMGLGFDVMHKENADQITMKRAIRQFGRKLREGGIGLFYYAGHGVQVKGRNYLIPVNAVIESESDVEYEAVDAGRVLGKMEDAGNDLNIAILDACRDNPFTRSFRSREQGLAKMDAPKGSLVAYSTAPGSIAADGTGRNGIFTKYLLKHMKTPGLTIERVLKFTRNNVMEETNDKQVPWESSSLRGDFYFASSALPITQSSIELADERTKLERERQELERLKLEFERNKLEVERKRFEEEQKKNTIVASIDPKDQEIGRDGHYIAYASGVVRDTKTGLEWVAGPDRDTTWDEAKQWIETLTKAGDDWQMPTLEELETLYQKRAGIRNITPLLKMTGLWGWSTYGYKDSWAVWSFGFHNRYKSKGSRGYSDDSRAFAVRSRSTTKSKKAEEETPKYASISPEVSNPKVIERDDHYIAYASGVVRDTKTGLEWMAGPDKDTNWHEAKQWVEILTVAGGDWRMPTNEELKALYQKGKGARNMTPLLKTTGWIVWSGERYSDSLSAWVFNFNLDFGNWIMRNNWNQKRAFAVRSRR